MMRAWPYHPLENRPQPNTDQCRWRILATWSIQLHWAVISLYFAKSLDVYICPMACGFCSPQGKHHPSSPAGNSLPHAAQEAAGLCCKTALSGHGQLGAHQWHQVLFWPSDFQPASPLSLFVFHIILVQVWHFEFSFTWNFPSTSFTFSKLLNYFLPQRPVHEIWAECKKWYPSNAGRKIKKFWNSFAKWQQIMC